MQRLVLAFLLAIALGLPAAAQNARSPALAEALAGQYAAALLRERRLADDRELTLIVEAEARLRDARRTASQARGHRAQAAQALDAARTAYVSLVASAVDRQALLRIEVEAFRAEIAGTIAQATPELIAAYQAFADSNRAEAWPRLEALLSARAAARRTAARAVAAREIAQLAQLRHVMVINSEASFASERALWRQAAELNPEDITPHLNVARLSRLTGDHESALQAASEAMRVARTDIDRSLANVELADNAAASGDLVAAARHYNAALEIERRLSAQDPNRLYPQSILYHRLAQVQFDQRDFAGAATSYEQSLRLVRIFANAAPNDPLYKRGVAVGLGSVAEVYTFLGRNEEALALLTESLALMRALLRDNPNNIEYRSDLASSLVLSGDMRMAADPSASVALYREALDLLAPTVAADGGNALDRLNVSTDTRKLGEAQAALHDYEGARRSFAESLAIVDQMIAADPNYGDLFVAKAAILNRLGDVQRDQGDAGEAAETYAAMLQTTSILLERQPGNPSYQRNVGHAIERLMALLPDGARRADVRALLARRQAAGAANESDRALLARLQSSGRLDGAWRGRIVDGNRTTPIELDILATGAGPLRAAVNYPGYPCAASWEAPSADGHWHARETVTQGRDQCVDDDVDLFLVPDGTLYAEFTYQGRTTAAALLKAAEGVAPH